MSARLCQCSALDDLTLCVLLARDWGRRGWPIEEVAEQLGLRLAELPPCMWREHELGMDEHLDEPECPECGAAACPAYAAE